jgi:hypothetical protein
MGAFFRSVWYKAWQHKDFGSCNKAPDEARLLDAPKYSRRKLQQAGQTHHAAPT